MLSYSLLEDFYWSYKSQDVKYSYNGDQNRSDAFFDKESVEVNSSKYSHPTNIPLTSKFIVPEKSVVDIWGKAAIGLYLWEHILEGQFEEHSTVYSFGQVESSDILFRFHTGPALTTSVVSKEEVTNVILVLNGREPVKIAFSAEWLSVTLSMSTVKNIGLVVLGNEQCDNTWLISLIASHTDLVKFVFIVYDSPEVDHQLVYQWPLGVATYRLFPHSSHVEVDSKRLFRCNFVGTIYKNSSRELLLQVLENLEDKSLCFVKPRHEWLAKESEQSMRDYVESLQQSDLTLNPVGFNPECYRIYEAMSYGSVPVIEDRLVSSTCGSQSEDLDVAQPQSNDSLTHRTFRLLKRYKAPVIFVSDWRGLPALLEKEKRLTAADIVRRRKVIIKWYLRFKQKMKHLFISVVEKKFFN